MNPIILTKKFTDPDLNVQRRYKSLVWDDFLLTTFEKHNSPSTNDREYRLFKFDGYYYNQVWRGFIPDSTHVNSIDLRGVIQSPDGRSYIIVGKEDSRVFVLKGGKCSPLIEGANFAGLGYIYYSHSTHKYYGFLNKRFDSSSDYPRILSFAEISLNFTTSGDLPASPTEIRQVITRIVSFKQLAGRITTKTFANMLAPDMLISQFDRQQSVAVYYTNPDITWKHTLKLGEVITKPVHFDLHNCTIRRLPLPDSSKLLSINPVNPCEMLYLHYNKYKPELALLVANRTGIELEQTVPAPFHNDDKVVHSYCVFEHLSTGIIYYWSYESRMIIKLGRLNIQFCMPSHLPNVIGFTDTKYITLRPSDILDRLASSGDMLSSPVSRLISNFLRAKYNFQPRSQHRSQHR